MKFLGNDWPTLDGTPIRDYIHVMDVADAHIKVLENLFINESSFLKCNIGTGKGTSVMELLKIFEKVWNSFDNEVDNFNTLAAFSNT